MSKRRIVSAVTILFLPLAASQLAQADTTETFTGTCGTPTTTCGDSTHGNVLSASASFDLSGTTLTVTLDNTSTDPVVVPTDVLTGVFFDLNAGTLTNGSAALSAGSKALNGDGTVDNGVVVGDYWGYASGVSAHAENFAISATGAVNGLGHANFGDGSALQGVGGGNVSGIASNANGGVTGKGPYFDSSVVFTFTTSSGFTLSDLGSGVVFQYGTALSDTSFNGTKQPTPVPEASTVDLLAADFGLLALYGVFYYRRRKRHVSART
jgi:hypothetical protein